MTEGLRSLSVGAAHLITLDRPERRNALTPELCQALTDEIDRVSAIGEARAILLNGAGGHFCVGLDLQWIASRGTVPDRPMLEHGLRAFQGAILSIISSPLPVIALLTGTTAGFGLDLGLACDMRVAGQGATFTSAFARMGLVPDGGSTLTLPLLLGQSRALRLLLCGDTIDATRALSYGMVNEVVPDVEVEEMGALLAANIATQDESSVSTIKRLVRAPQLRDIERALAEEGAAQLEAIQSPAFAERLRAFMTRKEKPA